MCKVEETDLSLCVKFGYDIRIAEFLCMYLFLHGFILVHVVYEYTLIARRFGHEAAIVNELKVIYTYILTLQVLDIARWSINIMRKAATINSKLVDFTAAWKTRRILTDVQSIENLAHSSLEIHFFLLSYDKLCDMIDLYQNVYGCQIIVIMLSVIVVTVRIIHTGLMITLDTAFNNWLPYVWVVVGVNMYTGIIFLVFAIIITSSCNRASKEMIHTKRLCYKLWMEIAETEILQKEQALKEELSTLVLHSKIRQCKILACNFLPVDYTLLYAIFGAITAYTVVFLQLRIKM